jgi:two-component system phosphate regulon sensor histidine kinase PhoR
MPEIAKLLLLAAVGVIAWQAVRAWRLKRRLEALTRLAELLAGTSARQADVDLLDRIESALARAAGALERRLADARGEERRLRAVLSGMLEGVLLIDAQGTVLLTNQRAEAMLALPEGGHLGRPLIELTRNADLQDLVRAVIQEGGIESSPAREIVIEGTRPRVLQATAAPIEAGAQGAFVLVFHDITELKKLERMRRDFVANVSHEIRTPLAAIRGYAETLLAGELDDRERTRRFLAVIERNTERLGRLVGDLLTLSDLELGRAELRRKAIDPRQLIEATFETLRSRAGGVGIVLRSVVEPGTPRLDADEDRIEQALLNLVDNAIKYTPRGGSVTVTARLVLPGEQRGEGGPGGKLPTVEIAVADTGVGVPAQDLPRLSERFYRVDKARSRQLGGTGLGLAIVKHIVQAHGGWMAIESELNKGTTVRLFFPAADQNHPSGRTTEQVQSATGPPAPAQPSMKQPN